MPLATWTPGTLYLPGALVQPAIVGSVVNTAIPNANFESGDTGWTKGTGWSINGESVYAGSYSAKYAGPGVAELINSTKIAVSPGKSITAQVLIQQGASADGEANAAIFLRWYTAADALIDTDSGNIVSTGAAGIWKQSSVTAVAPPTAAKVSVGVSANNDFAPLYVDNFQWDYITGGASTGLVFKAVQTVAGMSGLIEPVWPIILGGTVVDNEVTWEAVTAGSVTWEASSVLTSGGSEPTWPEETGAFVSDNNISWEAVPLRITDENCPQTKVVAIAASKVFAGDADIVRFCATLNARDWTSEEDAGFLPTGLQQKGQVGVDAMGVYRGNLAVWSPGTFQIWQVDPDPQAMSLLDSMEGIGSIYQQAVQPVANDLFFLAALGVRTISVTAGSQSLSTGDAGVPIDVLVQAEIDPSVEPIATYYPSAGQYWLAFRTLTIPVIAVGAFLLTSTIYPVEAIDGMYLSASLQSGELQPMPVDSVDLDWVINLSDLHAVLITTPVIPDAMDLDWSITTSDLHAILLSTPSPIPDSMDLDWVIQNSDLDTVLVTGLMPDEALGMTVTFRDTESNMTPV